MAEDFSYLPGVLAEIAEVAGLPAALAIAEKCGGTRAYFPGRAPEGHWLTELVGREAANKICSHFSARGGGMREEIPLGPKNFYARARRQALALQAEGVSTSEIARRIGVSQRSLRNWQAEKSDPRQGKLF